jgi:hypothetical protein
LVRSHSVLEAGIPYTTLFVLPVKAADSRNQADACCLIFDLLASKLYKYMLLFSVL